MIKTSLAWRDISFGSFARNLDISAGRVDYDYFNAAIEYASNALYPDDPVVNPIQINHDVYYGETGAVLKPHIHWIQRSSNIPNWLIAYKKSNNGAAYTIETDYSNYTLMTPQSHAFTYVSGNLYQITGFGEIDISDLTISSTVDMVLFRDTTNVSTLFAGADPESNDILVKWNDAHGQVIDFGSRQEFIQ